MERTPDHLVVADSVAAAGVVIASEVVIAEEVAAQMQAVQRLLVVCPRPWPADQRPWAAGGTVNVSGRTVPAVECTLSVAGCTVLLAGCRPVEACHTLSAGPVADHMAATLTNRPTHHRGHEEGPDVTDDSTRSLCARQLSEKGSLATWWRCVSRVDLAASECVRPWSS